jgi:predicted Zn-dependent peptidase
MKMKQWCAACAVLTVFFTAGARGADKPEDPLAMLKAGVSYKKLGNGVNVIVVNRGYSPTLALLTSFRVGSADESYKTIGAAHLLEHMLFKGTDRVGTKDYAREKPLLDQIELIGDSLDKIRMENPGDKRIPGLVNQLKKLQSEASAFVVGSPYDKTYSTNGGVGFNAWTSRDMTAYFIELPSSKLELWAQLESERLRNPVMREFYLERNAVMEERLMRYDSKGSDGLMERFIATAFLAHPYRHPVIGWASSIRNLSVFDVKDFYKTNYIPSHMTITIAGKQNPDETFAMVEKYFGKLEGKDLGGDIPLREPARQGETRVEYRFDANPCLFIGWGKPNFQSPDDIVCDVIAGLLADGKTSRLYRSLVIEKKLAASVEASADFPGVRYDNLFLIEAEPRHPRTAQELEDAIYEEIERLKNEVNEEEIARVVSREEASFIFDLASNKGVARTLNYYQTVFGDWQYALRYLDMVKTVTPARVKEVLAKYFVKENRTVGVLVRAAKQKSREPGK